MNDYQSKISTMSIFSDVYPQQLQDVLDEIIRYFQLLGEHSIEARLEGVAQLIVPAEEIAIRGNIRDIEREKFEYRWSLLDEESFSLETLKKYAKKDNPKLYGKLSGLKLPADWIKLKKTIWKDYFTKLLDGFREGNVLPPDSVFLLEKGLGKRYPESHIFLIFFYYKMMDSYLVGIDGRPSYHGMGRGHYTFGMQMPFTDEEGKGTGQTLITSTPSALRGLLEGMKKENLVRFVKRHIKHEYVGHFLRGLPDRYDGKGSVMEPKESPQEMIKYLEEEFREDLSDVF